jgi:hypothetical protein
VTAIRDRQSDPDADEVPVPWDERPIVGAKRGLPWWGGVLLGFGLAILGAFVNMKIQGHLDLIFTACYFVGTVGAVCAVQRRGIFGPMVQPPLVLAITVPGVVLFASSIPANADTVTKALDIGRPLINGFPTMAITTGATLLIGFFRMYRERNPNAPAKIKSSKKTAAARAKADDQGRPPVRRGSAADARSKQGPPTPPPRRRPNPDGGTAGGPVRRTRPAPEDGVRRRRDTGEYETGGRETGGRPARKPAEPPARNPRQPRAPRPAEGDPPPRRRDPRAEGAPGSPRARRPQRPDAPRGGADDPRRAPRREDPRRGRPWDDEA